MKNSEALKFCPFCGGIGKLSAGYSERDREAFYYVRCMKCGARGASFTDSQIKSNDGAYAAVKAWNRRTDSRTFPAAETPEKGLTRTYYPENAGRFFPAFKPDADAATPADIENEMKQKDPEAAEDPETTGAELSEDPGQDPDTTPAEDPAADPEAKNQEDDPQPVNFA